MNEFPEQNESPPVTHAVSETNTRKRKAAKIIAVLSHFTKLTSSDILDIGTGSGHIIAEISKKCRSATSVNVTDERIVKEGYTFRTVQDENLPFPDASFDVVISNHVLEHVPDQQRHLAEMNRVLRPGGFVYLATPNRFAFIEPHYRLPFLSWLPAALSQQYLYAVKKKSWDIHSLSYGNLVRLTGKQFNVKNMSIEVLHKPDVYRLDMLPRLHPIFKRLPKGLLTIVRPILPTYILLLFKHSDELGQGTKENTC